MTFSYVLYGLAVALSGLQAGSYKPAEQIHDYHVQVDPRLAEIAVTACFDGWPPSRLVTGSRVASDVLIEATAEVDGERRPLRHDRGQMQIPQAVDDGCIRYRVDLGRAMRSMNMGIAARAGDAAVVSPRIWLWRPSTLTEFLDIRLHFDLPEGMRLSGPWREAEGSPDREWEPVYPDGEQSVYHLGHPPAGWDSSMLIGRFERTSLDAGGLRLAVARANGPGEALPPSLVRDWLERGLKAGAAVWGAYPVDQAQAIVVPLDLGERPLAEARVSRAGGMGLLFGMGTEFSADEFREDALIAHEFMHLLHPPVKARHNWLSEGIATYYQYIGLARAGLMEPETAWRRFMTDLDDGRWDRRPGTLLDVSAGMGERGGADYVYWSGAALMLKADLTLRRRSDGEQTLDDVLARWSEASFDSRRSADGLHVLRRLDEIAGVEEPVFEPLYDDYVLASGFPDIGDELDALGLPQPGEDFALDDDAPLADLRRAIMAPPAEPLLPVADESDEP